MYSACGCKDFIVQHQRNYMMSQEITSCIFLNLNLPVQTRITAELTINAEKKRHFLLYISRTGRNKKPLLVFWKSSVRLLVNPKLCLY